MTREMAMSLLGLFGSILTMVTTAYVWLAKLRNERARLKAFLTEQQFFPRRQVAEVREVGVHLSVIVANHSTLPNALLGARAWLQGREGGCLEVQGLGFDERTPLPINLPPLQTVLIRLRGWVSFPVSQGLEADSAYLSHYLADGRPLELELRALHGHRHRAVLRGTAPAASAAA
jgi:hypothetical protein